MALPRRIVLWHPAGTPAPTLDSLTFWVPEDPSEEVPVRKLPTALYFNGESWESLDWLNDVAPTLQ